MIQIQAKQLNASRKQRSVSCVRY